DIVALSSGGPASASRTGVHRPSCSSQIVRYRDRSGEVSLRLAREDRVPTERDASLAELGLEGGEEQRRAADDGREHALLEAEGGQVAGDLTRQPLGGVHAGGGERQASGADILGGGGWRRSK